MRTLKSRDIIPIFSVVSVPFGLTLVASGSKVTNQGSLFETLGLGVHIAVALFCSLLFLSGYFCGSRKSNDAEE